MLKTGSVLEFWPRIGLDKSFQDWILTKVHTSVAEKFDKFMRNEMACEIPKTSQNPFGIHFFKPTPNTLRMGCIFIYF